MNPPIVIGEVNNEPSKVILGQAKTVEEIIKDLRNGIIVQGTRMFAYDEEPFNPYPTVPRIQDKTDLDHIQEKVSEAQRIVEDALEQERLEAAQNAATQV